MREFLREVSEFIKERPLKNGSIVIAVVIAVVLIVLTATILCIVLFPLWFPLYLISAHRYEKKMQPYYDQVIEAVRHLHRATKKQIITHIQKTATEHNDELKISFALSDLRIDGILDCTEVELNLETNVFSAEREYWLKRGGGGGKRNRKPFKRARSYLPSLQTA